MSSLLNATPCDATADTPAWEPRPRSSGHVFALRGDVKMNSRIPTNASENGGGEMAGHNGELLIANDFLVARLGLGTMRLTGKEIWGDPADRSEAIRVVRRAAELGVNFF